MTQQSENEMPRIIAPVGSAPMTPEEAAKGETTVTMEFPTHVHLTLDTNKSVFYPQGTHEVPERYSDHFYLKAHRVKLYARPNAAQSATAAPVATGLESLSREELLVLAKGYGLTPHPSTGVPKLIEKINAAKASGAISEKASDPAGDDPGAQSQQ